MFERLAGKVLTRLLSKYFVQENGEELDNAAASAASGGQSSTKSSSTAASGSGSGSGSGTKTQLGVWSGYVALDNLLLKNSVVNSHLKSRGLPFELLRCSIGRVEITVPWGKLGLRAGGTSSSSSKKGSSSGSSSGGDGAVVVVVDSVHVLLASRYEFDDDAVESARVKKRREELAKSEGFVRPETKKNGKDDDKDAAAAGDDSAEGLAGFFKSRLKEGIVNDVLDKVQIHIRDVHVRFEDIETDALNPHACGLTLESIHVQSDGDGSTFGVDFNVADRVSSALDASVHSSSRSVTAAAASSSTRNLSPSIMDDADVVRKMIQLNRLAIYWNELDPTGSAGHGPAEIYIIQYLLGQDNSDLLFSQAMNDCIARRSSVHTPSSPAGFYPPSPMPHMSPMTGSAMPGAPSAPTPTAPTLMHTYLLLPMDGTLRTSLSKTPHNLRRGPALSATLSVDSLAYELRDFQYSRILGVGAAMKYHKFAGKYRRRRPRTTVHDDPRAWWMYAIGIVQEELRQNRTRWSFRRFHNGCVVRKRYCMLYERYCWGQLTSKSNGKRRTTSRRSGTGAAAPNGGSNGSKKVGNDDGLVMEQYKTPLTSDELMELQRIDDGAEGDMAIDEILFLRALVNARIASRVDYTTADAEEGETRQRENGSGFIRGMIQDDFDAEEEYERLLAYLEASSKEQQEKQRFADSAAVETCISVSLQVVMKYGSLSLFTSRNGSFTNLSLASSAQRSFMEFTFCDFQTGYTLLGNYKSFEIDFLLGELEGSEVRANGSRYILLSQIIRNKVSEKDIPLLPPPSLGTMGSSIKGFLSPKRSASNISANSRTSPTNKVPLMSCRMAWKPPRAPHFDVSLAVTVEEMEFIVSPNGEWPLKMKDMFSHRTNAPNAPNASDFWENINMAYINTLESAKAGVQAKAALAFTKHKNIDVNIMIDCPIISIGDDEGSRIIIDLGNAYLATESLAGVARGHINGGILRSEALVGKLNDQTQQESDAPLSNGPDGKSSGGFTTRNLMSTATNITDSPTRSVSNFSLLGTSAMMSPSLSRKQSRGDSFSIAGKLKPISEVGNVSRSRTGVDLLHSCFYDSFLLRLGSITVSLPASEKNAHSSSPLVQAGFSLVIEKSVISSDHTIPKIKVNCIADELSLSISRQALTCIGSIIHSWSTAQVVDEPTAGIVRKTAFNVQQYGMTIGDIIGESNRVSVQSANQDEEEEVMSEAASDVDEMEFLDAVDTESGVQDDVSVWFEENWNTDAESLATRSMFGSSSKFRTPRARLPSISDVSSKSTRSRKSTRARPTRRKVPNAQTYLNAENLARLDESGIDENQSSNESEASEADSFHSAMSLGGLGRLVDALQEDISQVEKEIEDQKVAVQEAVKAYRDKYRDGRLTSKDKQRHRRLKEEMKVELQRCEAELKALRAAYEDTNAELSSAKQLDYEQELNGESRTLARSERSLSADDGNAESVQSTANDREVLVRARSLLEARAQRASMKSQQHDVQHSITKWLNRDIFFGAFSAARVSFELLDDEATSEGGRKEEKILDFSISGLNASLSKRTFDTRVFAAVEHVAAASDLNASKLQNLILSGGVKPDDTRALAAQYSHLVSSSFVQEDFLTIGIELRRRSDRTTGAMKNSIRSKIALGVTEICIPDATTLKRCFDLASFAKECAGRDEGGDNTRNGPPPATPSLIEKLHENVVGREVAGGVVAVDGIRTLDVAVQADGINLRLSDHGGKVDAAFCLAGIGARMARQHSADTGCRVQMDFKLTNAQLLDIMGGRELLGRSDIYRPLMNARLRSQLVSVDNLGGWTVDADNETNIIGDKKAFNCHFGMKAHSLNIHATLPAFNDIKHCVQATANGMKQKDAGTDGELQSNADEPERMQQATDAAIDIQRLPLRWRADIALGKTSITLPSEPSNATIPDAFSRFFCLSLTSAISVQRDASVADAISFAIQAREVSIQRASDQWNLLEPAKAMIRALVPAAILPKKLFSSTVTANHVQLQLPTTSPWNNNEALTAVLLDPKAQNDTSPTILVAIQLSDIRTNYSALVCCEVLDAIKLLKVPKSDQDAPKRTNDGPQKKSKIASAPLEASITCPSLDLTMYDEITIAGGTSHKNPLTVLSLRGIGLSMKHKVDCSGLELNLDDASLYDLTPYPGVCVLGPIARQGGRTLKGGYKIVAELKPDAVCSGNAFSFEVHLGNYQMILLPSLFKTAFDFVAAMKQQKKSQKSPADSAPISAEPKMSQLHKKSLPFNAKAFHFSVQASGFELILSSRDIPAYLNTRTHDPISVISFRWQAALSGDLRICNRQDDLVSVVGFESSSTFDGDESHQSMLPSLLALCSSGEADQDNDGKDGDEDPATRSVEVAPMLVHASTTRIRWDVSKFQALRTAMKLVSSVDLKKRGIDSSMCCFIVQPPTAGEQQIVSPFDLRLVHSLAATAINTSADKSSDSDAAATDDGTVYNIAHAFKTDVNFVDVLLYIKQSVGGINEALHASVLPILGYVKEQKGREKKIEVAMEEANTSAALASFSDRLDSGNREPPPKSVGIADTLKGSICSSSLSADGFRLTIVPGGATRLTENPIIKFALSNLKIGTGMSPIQQSKRTSGDFLEPVVSHVEVATWFECELSAHYHNKKLVSWEPLLEPWAVRGCLGCDITKALKLSPLLLSSGSFGDDTPSVTSPLSSFIHTKRFTSLINTIQSVRSSSPMTIDASESDEGRIQSSASAAYALLLVMDDLILRSALCPERVSNETTMAYSSEHVRDWLSLFGPPRLSARDEKRMRPSVLLRIEDCKTMNVNLTGAFISDAVGLLSNELRSHPTKQVAPHLIRNESGMTIRFREVLDPKRAERGEKSASIILKQGKEIPLSLKRDISQSCDPHQAYITLELGSFDETNGDKTNSSSWNKLLQAKFRAVGKIPVDSVGVHNFVLHRTSSGKGSLTEMSAGRASDPAVIIRVALRGGVKIVSVESPIVLCNTTGRTIYCEIAAPRSGRRLLHAELVPTEVTAKKMEAVSRLPLLSTFPIPTHFVPLIDQGLLSLSISCAEDAYGLSDISSPLAVPPRFSKNSASRGMIKVSEMSLTSSSGRHRSRTYINCGSVRIGSLPDELVNARIEQGPTQNTLSSAFIPEQRLTLFRPQIAISNHLPTAIRVQLRVKGRHQATLQRGLSWINTRSDRSFASDEGDAASRAEEEWEDLGIVRCGEATNWLGARASERVEMRVKLLMDNARGEDFSRDFPDWSSPIMIPQEEYISRQTSSNEDLISSRKMVVEDAGGTRLSLSVALEAKLNVSNSDAAPKDDARGFAQTIGTAPRSLAIFVPLWVVDSTGLDLEYATSSSHIAGQAHPDLDSSRKLHANDDSMRAIGNIALMQHGLADLLQDDEFAHLQGRSPFSIYMVGEERPKKLSIRRQTIRRGQRSVEDIVSSVWSNPIDLRASRNKKQDISVRPPRRLPWIAPKKSAEHLEPLALSSRMTRAPDRLGGRFGTKLVHIVNRYCFINLLDQDVEVVAKKSSRPVVVRVGNEPLPVHFNDAGTIRIRPKDFGWVWSSPFHLQRGQGEMFVRIRNRLTGTIIIAQIELREASKAPGVFVEIRTASHPPFRLENHTTTPLQFYQPVFHPEEGIAAAAISALTLEASDSVIVLPYHSANYAWDRPDEVGRSIRVEVADFGLEGSIENLSLGQFYLDSLVPGTKEIKLRDRKFGAEILADGPTRVFRISDASLPAPSRHHEGGPSSQDISIEIRLVHGVGISVIDWTPKELIYLRLSDIDLERKLLSNSEHVKVQIGSVAADNQLWVTPYPNLLTVGDRFKDEKRRKKERAALQFSWRRDVSRVDGSGITLLQSLDFSMRRLVAKADGNLIEKLLKMLKKASSSRSGAAGKTLPSSFDFRDTELWRALGLEEHLLPAPGKSEVADAAEMEKDRYSNDSVLTAATASKTTTLSLDTSTTRSSATNVPLGQSFVPIAQQGSLMGKGNNAKAQSRTTSAPASKSSRKYYIEKTRISTIDANISWTGKLPFAGTIPAIITPALTFEGLPLMLRSYSSSHTYGTLSEHVKYLKGHYINVWRIIDVLAGIAFNPTFMVRAYAYTWQQSAATFFDTASKVYCRAGDLCAMMTPGRRRLIDQSALIWGEEGDLAALDEIQRGGIIFGLYSAVFGGVASTFESMFRGFAAVNAGISSSLRYDGASHLLEEADSGRTRPPRIFANQEGNDLLVEYVEGENAGKALLSRVRMGAYLGEGYVYHGEGATFIEGGDLKELSDASHPMIYIMTAQRLLLLKGGSANLNFCTDVWGVSFERMIQVHTHKVHDINGSGGICVFEIMYFEKESEEVAERKSQRPKYLSEHVGLGKLHCASIKFPIDGGSKLFSEISRLTNVRCFGDII